MATFALVTEGLTDQIIIERMIDQLCGDVFEEGVDINPLQPLRDATDKFTAPHAGWELVFEYCQKRVAEALEANDYIVIHLDTDEGDHPNFGLALTQGGRDRPYDALIEDAIEILVGKLSPDLYDIYADRILFAISVHSIESWLLLCLFSVNETKSCFGRLHNELIRKEKIYLNKTANDYYRISKRIKRKQLIKILPLENSLSSFLRILNGISLGSADSLVTAAAGSADE